MMESDQDGAAAPAAPLFAEAIEDDEFSDYMIVSADAAPSQRYAEAVVTANSSRAHNSQKLGAGVAGAVAGFCLGGPVGAVLAGIGAAYAAKLEGPAGDVARMAGDAAVSVGETAKKLKDDHLQSPSETNTEDTDAVVPHEGDDRNWFLQNTMAIVSYGARATMDFAQRHDFVERTAEGVRFLARKVTMDDPDDSNSGETSIYGDTTSPIELQPVRLH